MKYYVALHINKHTAWDRKTMAYVTCDACWKKHSTAYNTGKGRI